MSDIVLLAIAEEFELRRGAIGREVIIGHYIRVYGNHNIVPFNGDNLKDIRRIDYSTLSHSFFTVDVGDYGHTLTRLDEEKQILRFCEEVENTNRGNIPSAFVRDAIGMLRSHTVRLSELYQNANKSPNI
jgi:hypothetical protein